MTHRLTAGDKEAYAAYAMGLISGSFDLVDAEDHGFDANLPVFTVGQTADLVNIHPQTLRQYDRLDLIVPRRTPGGARRYSLRDISRLVTAQHLVNEESINLAGVSSILQLMEENRQLRRQVRRLKKMKELRVFSAEADGNVTEVFSDDSLAEMMKRELAARRRRLRMARARGRMLPAGTYGRVQLRITSYSEEREEEE